jgi:hypothetical protein
MTDRERKQLQGLLKEGKERLRESVASIRPADGYHRPTPDRWSVVEIIEHVVLAEDAMFHMAAIAFTEALGPPDYTRDAKLIRWGQNRARRYDAPAGMAPKGRFPTLAAAMDAFEESRRRTEDYVNTTSDDLRNRTAPHPVGPIDAYQCFILLALHSLRHADQIREVREAFHPPSPSVAGSF